MANEPGVEISTVVEPNPERNSQRSTLKDELVQGFYGSSRYEELKRTMTIEFKRHGGTEWFSVPVNKGRWEGMIFEEMALDYYYSHLSPNPENRVLAEFLQEILQKNELREIDFYENNATGLLGRKLLTPEQRYNRNKDLNSTLRLLPDIGPVYNADALLIDIQTDQSTGRVVAKIIGVLDAKVGHPLETKQREGIKLNLTKLVMALKPHYSEVTQSLDIADALPQEIDIVSREKLGVKVIRPQESANDDYTNEITGSSKIYVPITRAEILDIVQAMVRDTSVKIQNHRAELE